MIEVVGKKMVKREKGKRKKKGKESGRKKKKKRKLGVMDQLM
jgi:hypothetical protein